MSARFWLFSLASAGAALVSGLGLGLYATTPPRDATPDAEISFPATRDSGAPGYSADLNGPTEVSCNGCGPTLAQRQMASMMGGWDGHDDPVVKEYMAQGKNSPEDLLPDDYATPVPPPRHLSPNVERFAAGDAAAPEPVQLAHAPGGVIDDVVLPAGGSY
ncbi:hypothetical protein [Sphingobium mellinum]|uniref:hypothetical protein n=1 Tax=Sphingobium mellinum TaxID=1387166 RepID=UPI0030EC3D6C